MILTARDTTNDKIIGLDSGADDYVTKPFSARELLARITAVLRRVSVEPDEPLDAGILQLRLDEHRVFALDQELSLGPTEFNMLKFFMLNPERVYSRAQILDAVWGQNVYIEERTVDVHVQRLRKVLTACGADKYIQTVRGMGYRFSSQQD